MRATTDPRNRRADRARRFQRLAWFVLLYAAGLAVTLVLAYALKALIPGA
jgi:hypothetical protein